MTENTTAAIAASLTAEEREALKMVNSGKVLPPYENELPFTLLEQLARKHLVYFINTSTGFSTGFIAYVTPTGNAVLSAIEAAPAKARPETTAHILDHQTPVHTRPTTMSARGIFVNLDVWAKRKDNGECHLIWKGDHIDGIGQVAPDGYMIEYGGQVNEPDIVTGDTQIEIKWLPQALTPPPADSGAEDVAIMAEIESHVRAALYEGVAIIPRWGENKEIERGVEAFGTYVDLVQSLQKDNATLRAQLATVTQERDAYKADNATLEHEANRAESRVKFMKHNAEMHREQYRQEHDNSMMLYRALTRNTPPEVYKPIVEGLFQSTNEYDKLMSEGSRWKEKHQREVWAHDATKAALAAAENRASRAREALVFYANPSVYELQYDPVEGYEDYQRVIDHDGGQFARCAIESEDAK